MAYRVKGNKLMENGSEIQLWGPNVTGMENANDAGIHGMWVGTSLDQFCDMIQAKEYYCVRLPITSRTISNVEVPINISNSNWIEGNKFLAGKKSMEVCDALLDALEKRGIHYYFDLHYKEDGFAGNIPPLWYTNKYSEDQWISDLTTLAKRYSGRKGFVGIDLKNEPDCNARDGWPGATWGSGDVRTDWKIAVEKAFAAIDAVNKDVIVIVEWLGTVPGLKQIADNPPKIPRDRIALSSHNYFPDVWKDFGEGFKDPSFPSNMPAIWERQIGTVAQTWLVIVGEFGGYYGTGPSGTKDKIAQDAFVDFCKARGILNVSYWQWGPNSGDTGGLLNDDWKTFREDKVALMRRLKTDKATPIGSGSQKPVDVPVVTTKWKVGQFARHICGEGPRLYIDRVSEKVTCLYWNPAKGAWEQGDFAPDLIVPA